MHASANSCSRPKTRVWGINEIRAARVGRFAPRNCGPHWETSSAARGNVSGSRKYLQPEPMLQKPEWVKGQALSGMSPPVYAYANNNPLHFIDPDGLESYVCRRPLGGLPEQGRGGPGALYHQYSCTRKANDRLTCSSNTPTGNGLNSPGRATTAADGDYYREENCTQSQDDNKCFESCLIEQWAQPRPRYGIPVGTDCQEYDNDVNARCRRKCGL